MAKKVVNIVKKNKDDIERSNEIFNLNEEIIIGVNSKNVIKDTKKNSHKNNKKKTSKKQKQVQKKNTNNTSRKSKNYEFEEEKNKKSHKFLKIFIIIILLLSSLVLFLLSPVFNITAISVKNNNKVSKEQIISLSQIKIGENIFKFININIMENVKENPYIDEVKIIRIYPSQIIIEVKERVPEYCLKIGENYAYINTQGYILEISDTDSDLPEFIGYKTEITDIVPGNRLVEKDLEQLEKVNILANYAKENEIQSKIISYTISEDKVTMELRGDKKAYIENFTNVNIKMLTLKSILDRTEGKPGEIFLDGQGKENSVLFRESV